MALMYNCISRMALVAAVLLGLAACRGNAPEAPVSNPAAEAAWATISDLAITDVVTGEGPIAAPGSMVEVHYEGWLYDPAAPDQRGRKFDTSRERGRPFRFRIGSGTVIKGWEEGVSGMRTGGTRELLVPARLGYGERGAGGGVIPPGAALLFEIELRAIE